MDIITYILCKKYADKIAKIAAEGLKYKGSVATAANLPTPSEAIKGNMYTTSDNGHEHVCDGTKWVDLSADLDNKQDKLTAGENIKIEGTTISADDTNLKSLIAQEATERQNADNTLTNSKQDKLTAGAGIVLEDNTISADVRTYKPFPSSWPHGAGTTITNFCAAVNASYKSGEIKVGDAFLGNVNSTAFFSGAYIEGGGSLGSAEVSVQIMTPFGQNCVQLLTTTSSNNAPYHWEYTYVDGAASEGWRCWSQYSYVNNKLSLKQDKLTAYLKSASVANNTLTLVNKDDTTVEYTPDIFMPFPDEFIVDGTTAEFATSVVNHPTFKAGKAWYGSLICTDLPNGLLNVECTVKALPNNIAVIELSSSNRSPYKWEYNTASARPGDEAHSDWKIVLTAQTRDLPAEGDFNKYNIQINRNVNKGYEITSTKALPAMPTEDGDYKLRISGGIASWVKE